jgi:FKBP-type peptidyl-prolyl cis-trans isomerase FklB
LRSTRALQSRRFLGLGVASAVLAFCAAGAEPLEDADARLSYSLGHQIGMDLARQGRDVEDDTLGRGLRDGLAGRESALPPAEMRALLLGLKRGIVASEREDRLRPSSSLRRAGEEFLALNAGAEGVVERPSGLQYRVIRPGSGPRPTSKDRVRVRYRSTRLDGRAFHDSLREGAEPETFDVGGVIQGLGEALQLMRVGARWEIFLPPELAFGRRGPLADHTVVYDLELIAVVPSGTTAGEGGG